MRASTFLPLFLAVVLIVPHAAADHRIRITQIGVADDGSNINISAVPLVDTVRDICLETDDPDSPVLEPFFDSIALIKVRNTTRTNLRFSKLTYTFGSNGSTFVSDEIAPGNSFDVPAGKTETLVASLFLWVNAGRKYFVGSDSPIAEWAGPIAVQFTLTGKDGRKKRVSASATTTVNFAHYNRCPAQ